MIPGIDNVARVARVRTGKSAVERAVQHLFSLELSCDNTRVTAEQATYSKLNAHLPEFQPRPKRQAAVKARDLIAAVGIEEEEQD